MGKPTTEGGDSSDQYSIIQPRPQSIGVTQRRRRSSLSKQWTNQTSPLTRPFCPETKKRQHRNVHPLSMSTFGFIAHALRPSTISQNQPNHELPQDAPQTVTGNSYLVFAMKNYGDNEMHWFWMVLICALLLFAWETPKVLQVPRPLGRSGLSTLKYQFSYDH